MKIVIVGAQGVGKTTLLNKIEESCFLKDFIFIKEIVRELVREKNIKINQEADFDSQMMIFEKHLSNINLEKFISDRSCIDAITYAYRNFKKEKFTETEFSEFEEIFLNTLPYYDKIFFIPVEFELESDGFRDTDRQFQLEINDLFLEIFRMYGVDFIYLRGSLEERLNRFKFHVDEKNSGCN